jgi:hypothetical protein
MDVGYLLSTLPLSPKIKLQPRYFLANFSSDTTQNPDLKTQPAIIIQLFAVVYITECFWRGKALNSTYSWKKHFRTCNYRSRQKRYATIQAINPGMHSPSHFLDSSNRRTTKWYWVYVTSMRVVEESVCNCYVITWWYLIRCNSDTRCSV